MSCIALSLSSAVTEFEGHEHKITFERNIDESSFVVTLFGVDLNGDPIVFEQKGEYGLKHEFMHFLATLANIRKIIPENFVPFPVEGRVGHAFLCTLSYLGKVEVIVSLSYVTKSYPTQYTNVSFTWFEKQDDSSGRDRMRRIVTATTVEELAAAAQSAIDSLQEWSD